MAQSALFKSSINVKTLGNPKWLLGKYEMKEGDIHLLGTILGAATGVIKRENPKEPGTYWYGVSGKFEALPSDPENPAVVGSNLFAPDIIHEQIVEKLKKAGQGGMVKFAFEAYVKAGGTAGFTWEYRFLGEHGEPAEDDVLSSVRKLVGSKNTVTKLEDKRKHKTA